MSKLSQQDVDEILGGLHDFQRRTVEYVYRRMYEDNPPAHRFLVADEVGLGKTLVAKGLIAKAVHRLQREVQRVDVLYICSNAQIAAQNLSRLNVFKEKQLALATRLTLLPQVIKEQRFKENDVNFVSFTPGTALDHGLKAGKWQERRILYRLITEGGLDLSERGLANVLRGTVNFDRWKRRINDDSIELDEDLGRNFVRALKKEKQLLKKLKFLCEEVSNRRTVFPKELSRDRLHVIGELRKLLARVCITALEPDLIIIDEFQRFRHILTGEDDAALLARQLMDYCDVDTGECARTVLLSATPYKMLTLSDEEENHYEDFLKTLQFLLNDEAQVQEVKEEFKAFRKLLIGLRQEELGRAIVVRDALQRKLQQVMVRTERLSAGVDRDAMLEQPEHPCTLQAADLHHARAFASFGRALESRDVIEYWKSCAYPINFMSKERYGLKKKMEELAESPPPSLVEALANGEKTLLNRDAFAKFQQVDPGNARLRRLLSDTVEEGQWAMLWLPPSLPYYQLAEPWIAHQRFTKSLIFSHWNVVPDAIASLCSYEAERRMTEKSPERYGYFQFKSRKPLLRYNRNAKGEAAGLGTMLLTYPSPKLAEIGDPLNYLSECGSQELSLPELRSTIRERLSGELSESGFWERASADKPDEQNLWYAAAMLAIEPSKEDLRSWIESESDNRWVTTGDSDDEDDRPRGGDPERQHRQEFLDLIDGAMPGGSAPDDLLDVLTDLAVASPGVTAARALSRAAALRYDDHSLLTAATRSANGLRSLFNQPESIVMLRQDRTSDGAYWRQVLDYCARGNLQAVLDEYAHVLWDQLALQNKPAVMAVSDASMVMEEVMSLRPSSLSFDTFTRDAETGAIKIDGVKVRCRYALRLGGNLRDEDGTSAARAEVIRKAFNSPFRPFILATTSIGQEGLDFHPYCHVIYHWNLPSNPVDLEQREGRIHRYKGHAVRKNVASACAQMALTTMNGSRNVWELLFQKAIDHVPDRQSDLVPYWLFPLEGGAAIERRVPIHALSRDSARLRQLKRSLAVYRLAFGQPRQEDLLSYLEQEDTNTLSPEDYDQLKINLHPPEE